MWDPIDEWEKCKECGKPENPYHKGSFTCYECLQRKREKEQEKEKEKGKPTRNSTKEKIIINNDPCDFDYSFDDSDDSMNYYPYNDYTVMLPNDSDYDEETMKDYMDEITKKDISKP